ncbi:MAG: mycothiol transferase [Acidimicrobiales bacterium]
MPSVTPNEHQALLHALTSQREQVFEALHGLEVDDLRRQVLPSRWTCLGLVNHLSLDVERFWFQAVIAGDQSAIDDVLGSSDNAWQVGIEVSAEAVLEGYRRNIERGDAIITTGSLDEEPAWWPESLFGSRRLNSVREIVLHVITETAAHVGHLDAARELIDGKQRRVLTE